MKRNERLSILFVIMAAVIETKRLILRQWCDGDLASFAALNADARVMEYFPATLSREASDAVAKRLMDHIQTHGWGMFAATLAKTREFVGFIGIMTCLLEAPFNNKMSPVVEIGWRLAHPFWGKGYATEGALACLEYGFKRLGLEEIVAYTATNNKRSRAVMERIGMNRDPKDDFSHPKLPLDHPIAEHVLYRIRNKSS